MKKLFKPKVFLLLATLLITTFALKFSFGLYKYFFYSQRVAPLSCTYHLKASASEEYTPLAYIIYSSKGKQFSKTVSLSRVKFKNIWQAEDFLEGVKCKPLELWMNPTFPKNICLEHHFPYKEGFSFLLILIIFMYFYFLARYVQIKV